MEATSIIAVAALTAFGLTELVLRPGAVAHRFEPDVSDRGTSFQILISYVTAVILLVLIAPATPWLRLAPWATDLQRSFPFILATATISWSLARSANFGAVRTRVTG